MGSRFKDTKSSSLLSSALSATQQHMTNTVNGTRLNSSAICLSVCLSVCAPTYLLSKLALSSPGPRLFFSTSCVAVLCLSAVCLFQATCSYRHLPLPPPPDTLPLLSPSPIWHPAKTHLSPSIHSPTFFHHLLNHRYHNLLSPLASSLHRHHFQPNLSSKVPFVATFHLCFFLFF